MSKDLRITFTDKEKDLTEYLDTKCNPRAFIKDLIYREMVRDNNYVNCNISLNIPNQSFVSQDNKITETQKEEEQNFDFDIGDLDI